MTKYKLQGHIIILIVNLIFALNVGVSKSLLPEHLSPMGLTVSRILFGCIAFWAASIFTKQEKVSGKDMFLLFICGICGLAINQGIFIAGLNITSPVDASILVTCTPLIVMVFAFFILKEPITWKKAGGVLLGASGAILLILSGEHGEQDRSSLGNFLVICSGFSYSIYLVIAKPLTLKYSAVTMMKWMFLFSTIIITPFGYKDLITASAYQAPLQANVLLNVSYVLFGATFITYLLIPLALKRIRPTTMSMYNYVQPIIAALIAVYIGHEEITVAKILCSILIFVGVYLVTISKSRADIEKEASLKQTDTRRPNMQKKIP